MIFHWPRHVRDAGAIRRQFVDVIDIAPTLLDAAGARFDSVVEGVPQIPVAGRSFLPTVRSGRAPGRQVQYFELRGNWAITSGRWRAVANHDCDQSYANDQWEVGRAHVRTQVHNEKVVCSLWLEKKKTKQQN